MPDELEPPPPESELDEAEAIISALGAGTKVSPDLPDEGPGLLIKGLAAHRDDIDREPLRDIAGEAQRGLSSSGGHMSGFDELANQFEGLLDQVPSVASAEGEIAAVERDLEALKNAAKNITGETAGAAFLNDAESVAALARSTSSEVLKLMSALNGLREKVRSTANEIRNRALG